MHFTDLVDHAGVKENPLGQRRICFRRRIARRDPDVPRPFERGTLAEVPANSGFVALGLSRVAEAVAGKFLAQRQVRRTRGVRLRHLVACRRAFWSRCPGQPRVKRAARAPGPRPSAISAAGCRRGHDPPHRASEIWRRKPVTSIGTRYVAPPTRRDFTLEPGTGGHSPAPLVHHFERIDRVGTNPSATCRSPWQRSSSASDFLPRFITVEISRATAAARSGVRPFLLFLVGSRDDETSGTLRMLAEGLRDCCFFTRHIFAGCASPAAWALMWRRIDPALAAAVHA
mgnify:CR=1 FL=1